MMRQEYRSLPYNFRVSSNVWTGRSLHSAMAFRYFSFLDEGRETLFSDRFHRKPMKGTVEEIGMSLDISQGMPKGIEMSLISWKS